MRRITILILLTLCTIANIRAQGVPYFQGTVYQAMEYAQSQQKMMIVEFYAPWNYKSKWMNQNIIANREIYNAIDQSFVIVQVDTQTTDGAKLAETYQVSDYPSFAIFNVNGNVVDKIEKTLDREDFLARLGQIIIENDGKSNWELRKIYTAIQNNNPILADNLTREYIERVGTAKAITPYHWELFSNSTLSSYGTSTFEFILQNRTRFNEVYTQGRVDELIIESLSKAVMPYAIGAYEYDSTYLEQFKQTVQQTPTLYQDVLLRLADLGKYRHESDPEKFIIVLESIIREVEPVSILRLLLSMEFIAKQGTRDQKVTARRMIEKYGLNTHSVADYTLIDILDKELSE